MTRKKPRTQAKGVPKAHTVLFPEITPTAKVGRIRGPEDTTVRQEVLNVLTAQLLQERGLVVVPEQVIRPPTGTRRMPDVLLDFQGLRLAIEGEFASPKAAEKASKAALRRVEEGIAHIGMALVYPATLRSPVGDVADIKRQLEKEQLQFAVITESEASQHDLPFPFSPFKKKKVVPFIQGDLNALSDTLRRSYEQLIKDEVLDRAVGRLEQGIGGFIGSLLQQPATTNRFAAALGIRELPKRSKRPRESED